MHLYLDCDGVVFDSNELKKAAFLEIAKSAGVEVDDKMQSYLDSVFGKASRHEILRTILGRDRAHSEFDVAPYVREYGERCTQLYIDADFTAGVTSFVHDNSTGNDFSIVTSDDSRDLRYAFAERGLQDMFKNIFGYEFSKAEVLADAKSSNRANSVLMIGDFLGDARAAEFAEVPFVFLSGYSLVTKSQLPEIRRIAVTTTRSFEGLDLNTWIAGQS